MQGNQFGKVSSLALTAEDRGGETILTDVKFTAPYKIMQPFRYSDGSIDVMLLAASAGIMEGDRQKFDFQVRTGARMGFLSQSYDKIHQMKEDCAKRETDIHVEAGASFYFHPQPVIPFRDSAYESSIRAQLDDETARFFMSDILSCGRRAMGEEFAYRFYKNRVEIRRAGQLIYLDNTWYDPKLFPMEKIGLYEGYSHLLNIFCTKPQGDAQFTERVHELIEENKDIIGGITVLSHGDFAVRAFGHRAQVLEEVEKRIAELWKEA